jgi:iron complex outermembrane recepter protein
MKPLSRSVFTSLITLSFPLVHAETTKLDEVIVTASPLDKTLFQLVQPASVLKEKDLQLKLQPTLGETLNNEPGVSSTSFGPGASRPVIRGLGDDRVRVLQNGTSVLDVSNVSPDHALATDPLTIRSVEIVRGPATLLYGPNTIGGVVNVMDDRIPSERFEGKWPSGKFDFSAGSADHLFSESGEVTWGTGPLVFHLDGFHRETDDLRIPGAAKSDGTGPRGTLLNSATQATGAGLGASYIFEKGYLGISYSGTDSNYGTVAEPNVTIDMRQRRWDIQGAAYTPTPWLKEIDFKLGYSDYDHAELDSGAVGTQFLIKGYDARVEFLHEKLGLLGGAIGFESQGNQFSALGSEAFLPKVQTFVNSAFFFEEIPVDKLRFQFGARYDRQTNETETNAIFGPSLSREFNAFSLSSGIVYQPSDDYAATVSIAYTQRPPTYVELFANGPHIATGSFEVGDKDLGTEDSLALDVSLRKKSGRVMGSISGFYYRFNDFISAQPTGKLDPVDSLPIYAYQPIGADFYGGEIETTFHLLDPVKAPSVTDAKSPAASVPPSDQRLDLTLRADYVHAQDRSTREPIPRIPPFRTSAALDYGNGNFGAKLEGQYAARQERNANFELPTDGYFLLSASISYDLKIANNTTTIYLKGSNLTNADARQSTSFLKDIAPLAGRGIVAGIRTSF